MDGEGAVKEIPYARNIPPQAKKKDCVPSWITQEANGYVYMWYHPERVAPLWDLMVIPEYGRPDWTGYAKYRWNIYTAVENVSDNAVDTAHFRYVHRTENVPDYEFNFDGIHRSSIARAKLGTPQGTVDGAIESRAIGSQGYTKFTGISETMLIGSSVPVERDQIQYLYGFIQPKAEAEGPMAGVAKAIIKDICYQFDEDKQILDNHKRMDPPLICDGDGPFGRSRQFNSQFFVSRGNPYRGPDATDPQSIAAE